MSIVGFLIVGLIAGWIASNLMEGHGLGVAGDIIVGVIGALVGGLVFGNLGINGNGFWGALGMSLVGAVILLFIIGLFPHRGGPTHPIGKM